MKKLIALLLALTTLLSLAACGKNKGDTNTTGTQMEVPESALVILETVWNSYGENDKFFAVGGSYDEDESKNNTVDNAPGKYDLQNEGMTTSLMVPADQVQNLSEAASLMNGMMANHFTCGVFRMAEGADVTAFVQAMQSSIHSAQWLCGQPEKMLIAVIADEYVLAAYGLADNLNTFAGKLSAAYPGTDVRVNEAING